MQLDFLSEKIEATVKVAHTAMENTSKNGKNVQRYNREVESKPLFHFYASSCICIKIIPAIIDFEVQVLKFPAQHL